MFHLQAMPDSANFKVVTRTKTSRDCGGAVPRPKRIVLALASLGESCQPRGLPQSVHLIPATGQNLVRISLQRTE
jgi:hypothetical protein